MKTLQLVCKFHVWYTSTENDVVFKTKTGLKQFQFCGVKTWCVGQMLESIFGMTDMTNYIDKWRLMVADSKQKWRVQNRLRVKSSSQ